MMVVASYAIATLAMIGAAAYLIFRCDRFVSASTMLLGFLLLVYGPAYLLYMLWRIPISAVDKQISQSVHFPEITVALNLSIGLMFVAVVAGIELVNRLMPAAVKSARDGLKNWSHQPLARAPGEMWLLGIGLVLAVFMLWISYREHHLQILLGYLSTPGDEFAKIVYRQQNGGSRVYLFNLVTGTIAPMIIVWAGLVAWGRRSWILGAVTVLLLAATILGKLETLNKAPIVLFVLQLLLVGYLLFRNNLDWRVCLLGVGVAFLIFIPIFMIAIPGMQPSEAFEFFYYRAFDFSNAALMEYWGAIPWRLDHMWGGNLRVLSAIVGWKWQPSYDLVARLWRSVDGTHTTAMFIADAWADFSYLGVVIYSLVVGALCRWIDLSLLRMGKSAMTLAVLAASFIGIYNLMISALPTSIVTGGLGLPLAVAVIQQLSRYWQRAKPGGHSADAVEIKGRS
ncbi:hypothetical protein [Bradyrhizobium sp. WYCCWR 12699]|uniref:hypothetical protein n=1 Tax=Bradyrhizobium sp. WYCCWR 12699 TaxID=3064203 RepID=UPI0028A330E9|nr:hypothetical protein [Bradyrhizobium sp. WYCCWR 12699]MDT4740709.1 hypothetical protein [Bradyrhizobium sp. WYCCWR 12699]